MLPRTHTCVLPPPTHTHREEPRTFSGTKHATFPRHIGGIHERFYVHKHASSAPTPARSASPPRTHTYGLSNSRRGQGPHFPFCFRRGPSPRLLPLMEGAKPTTPCMTSILASSPLFFEKETIATIKFKADKRLSLYEQRTLNNKRHDRKFVRTYYVEHYQRMSIYESNEHKREDAKILAML